MSDLFTGGDGRGGRGRGAAEAGALRRCAWLLLLAMGAFWLPVGSARAAGPIPVACATADLIGAIAQANAAPGPDTIELAAGCVYTLTAVHNSDSGPTGLPTIGDDLTISGNGATIVRDADAPAFRLLASSASLTIGRLALANGRAQGDGGAIYTTGSLTLIDSAITGSSASGGFGGAIYSAGALTLRASTLANNQAVGGAGISRNAASSGGGGGGGAGLGGAIYSAAESSATIINSTLSGNQAIGGTGGAGGDNGANFAGGAGGGGAGGAGGGNDGYQGTAGGSGGFGGGGGGGGGSNGSAASSFAPGSPPAGAGGQGGFGGGGGGAGATRFGGSGNIGGAAGSFGGAGGTSSSSFAAGGGGGAGLGGAIYSAGASVTISSSTIYGNGAQGGAGGPGSFGAGNGADGGGSGGGVFVGAGTISYLSSILLGNPGGDCANAGGSLSSTGYNLLAVESGCPSAGGDVISSAPGLLPLASNGGPTPTHAIASDSPAIDAAASAGCPATDQRGLPRPRGAGCDIGAFEYQPPVLDSIFLVTSTADAGAGSLRQAILDSNANPGFDTIAFALPDGPQTIAPASPLPAISDPAVIDGASQPGYIDTPLVTLSGAGAGATAGLRIAAGGSQISGLAIGGFSGAGVALAGDGSTISANVITGNGGAGVAVLGGAGNSIRQNSIFSNGGLGIDLGGDGLSANDAGDADGGPNQLQNFPSIGQVDELAGGIRIRGTLASQPANYTIDLYASSACDPSGNGEGQTFLASLSLAQPDGAPASFDTTLERSDLAGQWITAVATDADGNSSEFAACAPVRTNDLWTNARPLNLRPTGLASQTGDAQSQLIAHDYQERWYVFPVTPGSRVRISLTGQPGSTLSLHRDLQKVYDQLGAPQSATTQAAQDLPSGFLPSGFLPSGFLPSGFLPSGFLPSGFLPSGFLPSGFLPSGFLPELYAGAVRDSLMAYAVDPNGGTVLSIDRNSWDLAENLYVRVTGPSNLVSPFALQVTVDAGLCASLSTPPASMPRFNGGAPANGSLRSLILWDSQRFAAASPSSDITALRSALDAFAARADVGGAAIDLAEQMSGQPRYPRVDFARQQAAANPSCVSAANLVAGEIKSVVTAYRGANQLAGGGTSLQYIVLVGGDESLPFFRYTDQAGLANENEYFPPVAESSPSNASLRQGRVLGQDGYGSTVGIWRGSYELPLPDLAVGRLVGDSASVIGLLNAYIAANGVVRPQSALVTGYDFVADGAAAVRDDLRLGLNATPRQLIQPVGEGPTGPNAWTADQLRQQLLNQRNDLVFFTGHFAAGNLLAADYKTGLLAGEVQRAPASFTNSILFGLGCHSGYNVPPTDAIAGFSPSPDWATAFASRGASYIAATGFAYGDTELVEYGERYLLNLARELRTGTSPVALGQAVIAGKQAYLGQKASLSGLDEKTLIQFALYGLPMLRVDMPGQRLADPGAASLVASAQPVSGPGAAFGLKTGQTSAGAGEIAVGSAPVRKDVGLTSAAGGGLVTASYFSGGDGVVANPIEPIQPLERRNVGLAGQILRGVGFRGGSYTDYAGITPLTSAPATEASPGHPSFQSDGFYPSQNWSANFYEALSGGSTQLMAVAGQYRSSGPGQTSGTARIYSAMRFRLFYIDASWPSGSAALRQAAVAPAPAIVGVTSERIAGGRLIVRVSVVDKASVGVQQVWITYTDSASPGTWQSIDLLQDASDPTLWTTVAGGVSLPDSARFMVQAANATGRVSLDTNLGSYYSPAPSTPQPTPPPAVATELAAVSVPASGVYGQPASLIYRLQRAGGAALAGQPVSLSLGGQLVFATTDAAGLASFSLTLGQLPGDYTAQAAFAGAAGFGPASLARPFSIVKDGARLTIGPAGPLSVGAGQSTGIAALLATDRAGGGPIADKTVIFIATGAASSFGQVAKTGQDGQAVLGAVGWPAGSYSVRAYFAGSVPLPAGSASFEDAFYSAAVSAAVGLTIAPAAPDTAIVSGPSGTSGDTVASFSFIGSGGQGELGFECSLDSAAFTYCVSPVTYGGLADGPHSFRVRAVDAADQADPTPAAASWAVRAIYRARKADDRIWIERNIALAGLGDFDGDPKDGWALVGRTNGSDDDGALRSFYVQGGVPYAIVFTPSNSKGDRCILITPKSLAPVKKGQARLTTTLADPVPCPGEAPNTTIVSGPSGTVAANTATFSFKGSGGSGFLKFSCSLDGAPFAPCKSPVIYRGLATGDHMFAVRATDASGTADPTPATRSWIVGPAGQLLYRARQDGDHILIERNIALAGLGDFDGDPKDGWAVVGSTSNKYDDGILRGFYEQNGVPYAIIANHTRYRGDRCILVRPASLAVVKKNQARPLVTVECPLPCPAP